MNLFDGIQQGLNEAVEYEKGNVAARTAAIEIQPVHEWSREEIREFRQQLLMTQKLFAALLGVSVKTVEAWESGYNRPSGTALRLMTVLKNNPEVVHTLYSQPV